MAPIGWTGLGTKSSGSPSSHPSWPRANRHRFPRPAGFAGSSTEGNRALYFQVNIFRGEKPVCRNKYVVVVGVVRIIKSKQPADLSAGNTNRITNLHNSPDGNFRETQVANAIYPVSEYRI